MLRYSFGAHIAGGLCAADDAFYRLEREVGRLDDDTTWSWFSEKLRALERSLEEGGGYDEHLTEEIEQHGFFGPSDVFERWLASDDRMYDIEALTAAFFVTLAPRLNAVKVAALRVYEHARTIDGLAIKQPQGIGNDVLRAAREVANYVKHRDEWRTPPTSQQARTLGVLVDIGAASVTADAAAEFYRFPFIKAACSLSGKDECWVREAVPAILTRCRVAGAEILTSVQADFESFAAEVQAVRTAGTPNRKM